MPKVTKIEIRTFGDILKQRKLQQKATEQQKIAIKKAEEAARFDTFVKETAREMFKGIPRYELQNFKATDSVSTLPTMASDNSIWAPWSKMSKNK